MFNDKLCVAANKCGGLDENQHIFTCPYLGSDKYIISSNVQYTDILGDNVEKQFLVMKIMMKRLDQRRIMSSTTQEEDTSGL